MSYFLGERPLETKGKSNEEIKQAIESETAPGATEATASRSNPRATTDNVNTAINSIVANSVSTITEKEANRRRREKELAPKVRKDSKSEKHKAKTHFPPGLVVSEKAKAKMEEQQAKIAEKQREKEAKRAEQGARWKDRADVVAKWEKWEEKQQAVKDKILAKWDARDKKKAEKRAARLAKLADQPEKLEKEKKKIL